MSKAKFGSVINSLTVEAFLAKGDPGECARASSRGIQRRGVERLRGLCETRRGNRRSSWNAWNRHLKLGKPSATKDWEEGHETWIPQRVRLAANH